MSKDPQVIELTRYFPNVQFYFLELINISEKNYYIWIYSLSDYM